MAATWRFILADPTGAELGELWQARSRALELPLNGLPTFSAVVDLDNPMVDVILGSEPLVRLNLFLKAYRNGTLLLNGPLTAGEEVGEESGAGDFSLSAGGPLWLLNSRLVGKTPDGYTDGTALAPKDLGEIQGNLIEAVNAVAGTGIRVTSTGVSSSSYVGPWHFKKVAEAITEIGPGLLGGPDFDITPEEPFEEGGQTVIGTFRAYGALGSLKPNVVFEYGTGRRNVSNYRRPITRDGEANEVYGLPPGYPDGVEAGQTVVSQDDDLAQINRGRFEDVVGQDVGPDSLRQQLVDEHVRVRKVPREQVLFTPALNATPDFGDYGVGDLVTARAVVRGRTRFDAVFRIYGVKFAIGDDGTEQIELTLVNEG